MVESSASTAAENNGGDQPRLLRLKQIEAEIREISNANKIYEADATPGYENLSFEEKNNGKYMCTFPYPYMNGYLHLGKFFTFTAGLAKHQTMPSKRHSLWHSRGLRVIYA